MCRRPGVAAWRRVAGRARVCTGAAYARRPSSGLWPAAQLLPACRLGCLPCALLAARRRRLRRSAPCHLKKNKRTEEVKIEEAKKGMELQNF